MNMRLVLRSLPYQPFFIAVFIGVSIYAPNRLYFPVEVMILPMCILISLIGAALIILRYARLDLNKGLIFISGALLLNFTYYSVYDMLAWKWQIISPATIIYGVLWLFLLLVIWTTTHSQANDIAQIFGVVAISLVIIGLANLGFSVVSDAKEISDSGFETQFQQYLAEDLTSSLNNRDFYFIILDRYPGEETLYAESGFNNSDFYENLTSLGFTVLRNTKSNYGYTGQSIPSMLNMDYYTSVKEDGYDEEDNRLCKFFKRQGFKFVLLSSNWVTTTKNDNADIVLNPYPIALKSSSKKVIFQKIMFFERTFIGNIYYSILHIVLDQEIPSQSIDALQKRIQNLDESDKDEFSKQALLEDCQEYQFVTIARYHVPYTFENLTQVPKIPGRKFVFAHINHWECVDNPTANPVAAVNPLVESLAKVLIEESDPDPIIVLLSDHGRKPPAKTIKDKRAIYAKYACYPNEPLDQDDIQASWYPLDNFEAFYLPDGGNEAIYSDMTPVNAWRMILNYYFGTDFSRNDERCYWYWRHDGIFRVYDNNETTDKYVAYYGAPTHHSPKPVAGNWNGDVKDTQSVFDPSSGVWFLDYDNDGVTDKSIRYGAGTNLPVSGDWNGDGKDTIGVFDPSSGQWILDDNNDGVADKYIYFGASTHLPVTGDWNGDGKDTIGVFDPSSSQWILDDDNDGVADKYIYYGASTHLPVTGDWDGDGKDTIGVFSPVSGYWHLDYDNDGVADKSIGYGASTHLPVTGDWNGDGKDAIGVFSLGTFIQSSGSSGVWHLDYDNDGVADVSNEGCVLPFDMA